MKKAIALLLAALLLTSSGCSDAGNGAEESGQTVGSSESESSETVVEEPQWIDSVPALNYDGYAFNIGWSTPRSDTDECAPLLDDITGDIVGEAVHQRNLVTESRLNIALTSQKITESWTEVLTAIQNTTLAGDATYDAYCVGTWFMFLASINGLLTKLDDISSLDLSHDWWDAVLNSMAALDGKTHYLASGKINYLDDYGASCIFFNKVLCRDLGFDLPYESVINHQWTFDRFLSYVDASSADLDGNGVYDEKDRYGLVENSGLLCRLLPGFNTNVVLFDEAGESHINQSEEFYTQLDRVTTSLLDPNYAAVLLRDRSIGYEKGDTVFPEGRAMFYGEMVGNITGFRESMEQDFGVVPDPMYDEEQENYYSSYNTVWGTSYAVPITNLELERTGWILDVMGWYSVDTIYPATIEKNILTKTVRDEESAEMLRIVFDSKFYELGQWGTNVYGTLCSMAISGNNNFASSMKSLEKINAKEFAAVKEYYDFGE